MKKRAIVFDDIEAIQKILKRILEMRGYEVMTYSNPDECPLQHEHDCRCDSNHTCADIIISDIDMPKVSGLQFVQDQNKKGCKITNIAFMSGAWSESDLKYARELGCKIFSKPFTIEEINDWLDECEKYIKPDRLLSDWFVNGSP
jgi:two-component system response regulator AtoC